MASNERLPSAARLMGMIWNEVLSVKAKETMKMMGQEPNFGFT
jgi:hypothetical protein